MQRVEAKKGLGQHFLTDKNIARKIVDSIEGNNFSTLIEIGPGMGILTRLLLEKNFSCFYAVELDKESVSYLSANFPGHSDKFILGDFLKHPLESYTPPVALIGNLPYFISSQIFFKVLDCRDQVGQMIFMIQKEVAERIAAPPGSKTYGILSVLLQAYYNIEYLFTVHEHCFSPAPKVKSAVIRLKRNTRDRLECQHENFHKVVKWSFNQRRKIIRNSLKSIFLNLPEESGLLMKRPEQLTVEQFAELTRMIEKLNN
jgi:16S rRNA (adenine1518-N6/adenine1519-N6)-dimethyltransferase